MDLFNNKEIQNLVYRDMCYVLDFKLTFIHESY